MCVAMLATLLAAGLSAAAAAHAQGAQHEMQAQQQLPPQEPMRLEQEQQHLHESRAHADGALWRWLTDNGAALNYVPALSQHGLRGGIAVTDIPAGGLVRAGLNAFAL